MPTASIKSPLDLPEVRYQIGTFLSLKDAISCSLVSKSWSEDFTRSIWHSINFMKQQAFHVLDPAIIAKHVRHIRIVKEIDRQSELNALSLSKNLTSISIAFGDDPVFRARSVDLLRRSRGTLANLDLSTVCLKDGGERLTDFDALDVLIPSAAPYTSRLRCLRFKRLRFTRESFSTLLAGCPLLEAIHIVGCEISGNVGRDAVHNWQVKNLIASLEQVISPDPGGSVSSLLVHFPNIKQWDICSSEVTLTDATAKTLKTEVATHCASLREIYVDRRFGPFVHKLLEEVFVGLTGICFRYDSITPKVILGLLLHKSLESIYSYDPTVKGWSYGADRVWPTFDSFSESWMIQLLPSSCPRLIELDLPSHVMDMDLVERMPWVCCDLKELRIRIRSLDTKELILAAINKWRETKRNGGEKTAETEDSTAIENRVARHLLKFPKLTTVWLGYKVWTA